MSKTNRFFEIIQILRAADTPVMAKDIAQELEVSKRTIYRDIAALQAMRTPIYGEAGVGYVMRDGYDLPPINFDQEEAEAITVGLSMVARTCDQHLLKAAKRAARKLHDAAPSVDHLIASSWGVQPSETVDLRDLREAIRKEQKLEIRYRTEDGQESKRTVLPLALIFYFDNVLLVAWCELRQTFRHFRVDRVLSCCLSGETFVGQGNSLREDGITLNGLQPFRVDALSWTSQKLPFAQAAELGRLGSLPPSGALQQRFTQSVTPVP